MVVVEWSGGDVSPQAQGDGPRHVLALLFGGRGDSRDRIAVGAGHSHGVTDPTHLHALQADVALLAGDIQNQIGSSGLGQRNSTATYASNFTNLNVTASATGISINGNTANVTINGATTGLTINNSPTSPAAPHAGVSPSMVMTFYIKL